MRYLLVLILMIGSASGDSALNLSGNITLSGGITLRGIAPSAAITDLTQIPNLFLYLKQDTLITNLSSNPASDTDNIRTWGDSSGNQRHCTTNFPASPPQYLTNQKNGQGAVNFATAPDSLSCGFSPLANTTIFVVAKVGNPGAFAVAVDSTNSASRNLIYHENTADKFSIFSGTIVSGTALVQDSWYILTAQFNASGNDIGRTNSLQDMTGDAGSQSLDGVIIGCQYDGTLTWQRPIGCVAIYNRILTAAEMDAAEAVLGQQFGITTF